MTNATTSVKATSTSWWEDWGHHTPPALLIVLMTVCGVAAFPFLTPVVIALNVWQLVRCRHHTGWLVLSVVCLTVNVVAGLAALI